MFVLLSLVLLTYHLFNFLTFMMVLELGEILVILLIVASCSNFGLSSLLLFIMVLIVISFAICALTVLVSSFSNQGYGYSSFN